MLSRKPVHELQVAEGVLDAIVEENLKLIIDMSHKELHDIGDILKLVDCSDEKRYRYFMIEDSQRVPLGNYYFIRDLEKILENDSLGISKKIKILSHSDIQSKSYSELSFESDKLALDISELKSFINKLEEYRYLLGRVKEEKMRVLF